MVKPIGCLYPLHRSLICPMDSNGFASALAMGAMRSWLVLRIVGMGLMRAAKYICLLILIVLRWHQDIRN